MKNNLKNNLTELIAIIIPLISILALVLIFYIPRANSYWNFFRQAPFYTGIYFWLSQRPDAFPFLSAFILGIIADVLGGVALGINITSFLVLYFISAEFSLRFNVKRFSYSWLLFATALIMTMIFKAVLVSLFYRTLIPLNLWAIEIILIIALYPLLARVYIFIERRYIHLEERYEKIEP